MPIISEEEFRLSHLDFRKGGSFSFRALGKESTTVVLETPSSSPKYRIPTRAPAVLAQSPIPTSPSISSTHEGHITFKNRRGAPPREPPAPYYTAFYPFPPTPTPDAGLKAYTPHLFFYRDRGDLYITSSDGVVFCWFTSTFAFASPYFARIHPTLPRVHGCYPHLALPSHSLAIAAFIASSDHGYARNVYTAEVIIELLPLARKLEAPAIYSAAREELLGKPMIFDRPIEIAHAAMRAGKLGLAMRAVAHCDLQVQHRMLWAGLPKDIKEDIATMVKEAAVGMEEKRKLRLWNRYHGWQFVFWDNEKLQGALDQLFH